MGKATAKYEDWPFFENNEVGINCVDFYHDSAITKQALMALTAPKINCVDFCHDSAKQASFDGAHCSKINCVDFCHDSAKQASLMALAAPKVENLGNF